MQRVQAAQHPRRLVVEVALAHRAVVLVRQSDVVHAVEQALDADARFRPRERSTRA